MSSNWVDICALDEILPGTGVAALVEGEQIAILRSSDGAHVYAISNFDPFSHAVNAMRALFAGEIINSTVGIGVGLMVILCAISLFFAGRAFAKSQA